MIEISAYNKARFSELRLIHVSSAVSLRPVFRRVKNFKEVNVVLRTITIQSGLFVAATKKNIDVMSRMAKEDGGYSIPQIA